MPRSRRGTSLVELLIAMTVASIFGAALLSFMLHTNQFTDRVDDLRSARTVGRSAINVLANHLRMVDPSWGIEAASGTSVTVKVPYALGVVCASTTTTQTIALLPVDSVEFAQAGYSGFAWRASDGSYTAVPGGTVTESGSFPSACTTAGVQQITAPASAPNQRTRIVTIALSTPLSSALSARTVVMMYRRMRFYFGVSGQSDLVDRTALWMDFLDDTTAAIEQVAPFDASAAFRFYVSGSSTAQSSAPGTLSTLRGLQLFLPGESDHSARARSAPEQANLTTAVFFVNTLTP